MSAPAKPMLVPGRVYRTADFAQWSSNPPRLAKRLVQEGHLKPLAHGLFAHPKRGRFGLVPPSDEELMRAFLKGSPFLFTGPERWNALGLGTTAAFAMPLVYNTLRSGRFRLGTRIFMLRRVAFPQPAPPEWFVVDLFENAEMAAGDRQSLAKALERGLRDARFDRRRLLEMAESYGSKRTHHFIATALDSSLQ